MNTEAGEAPDHWRLLVEALMSLRLREAVSVRSEGERFPRILMIVIRHHEDVVIRLILIGGRMKDNRLPGDIRVEGGHARPLCQPRVTPSLGPQRVDEAVEVLRPCPGLHHLSLLLGGGQEPGHHPVEVPGAVARHEDGHLGQEAEGGRGGELGEDEAEDEPRGGPGAVPADHQRVLVTAMGPGPGGQPPQVTLQSLEMVLGADRGEHLDPHGRRHLVLAHAHSLV